MILKKLFTDEDPFNIHKIMGFYCLLNFGIQITMYFFTREMYIRPIVLIPHFLLNAQLFVFSVLTTRPVADDGKNSQKRCQCLFGKSLEFILLYFQIAFIYIVSGI